MSTLRSFYLPGPAGRLECLLNTPPADAPNATRCNAALVCHPHPKGGGTMHNKVVYHAMKALIGLGLPVLRFNFRGVGSSEGQHDDGRGEQDDVRAALQWLAQEFGAPLLFAGFSFGSAVGMRVCCPEPHVTALIALGVPVSSGDREYDYPWLASCGKPKLFISGGNDEFGPRAEVERVVANAAGENTLAFVDGADHFFQSPDGPKLSEMQRAIKDWAVRLGTTADSKISSL